MDEHVSKFESTTQPTRNHTIVKVLITSPAHSAHTVSYGHESSQKQLVLLHVSDRCFETPGPFLNSRLSVSVPAGAPEKGAGGSLEQIKPP